MAKKRRRHRGDSHTVERDVIYPSSSLTQLLAPAPSRFVDVEDRRTYHPLGFFRPALNTYGGRAGPVVVTPQKSRANPFIANSLKFPNPNVMICVRRKTRREVLFAKKRTGKGARSPKRKNWFSKIGC